MRIGKQILGKECYEYLNLPFIISVKNKELFVSVSQNDKSPEGPVLVEAAEKFLESRLLTILQMATAMIIL